MAITNLLIKLKPEEIPEFLRDKFYELHAEGSYGENYDIVKEPEYVGWVFINSNGTIEFGEPGA